MKKNLLLLLFCSQAFFVAAQPLTPLTVNIEMRDTKLLAADVYIPQPQVPRPTILIQTPYNKNLYRWGLPLGYGVNVNECPYNIVVVDWRGFYGSVSAAVAQYDRGLDGYDCIEWIVQQDWSNAKIGTWGPSALGKIQFMTAKHQHPAHICAVPVVASPEYLYSEYYQGGVYREEFVQQLDALGYGMSTVLMANPYFNFVWQYTQNQNNYPQLIAIPCLMIGGWYDHDTYMKTDFYNKLRNQAHESVRDQQWLMMGPWVHGGHGAVQVGSSQQGELYYPEAESFSTMAASNFLAYYLLDADNNWQASPRVQYFLMGANEWMSSDTWPPEDETTPVKYYFTPGLGLRTDIVLPQNSSSLYVYDPEDPSPTHGGATLRNDLLQGPYDQGQVVEERGDILIFTSSQLMQPLVVKGRPRLKLFVSTDCRDTDVAVRLTDVYPDGRSMLLLEGIHRLRFDGGFWAADTTFPVPGEIREIDIELYDIAIAFGEGHRIRVDITGSNWPRYQRNKNTTAAPFEAGDTLVANNMVYHQSAHSSYLELPVVLSNEISNSPTECLSVYPNPGSGKIYIAGIQHDLIKTITVFTVQGKPVSEHNYCNSIDVSALKEGLYMLRIETENTVLFLRFFKE